MTAVCYQARKFLIFSITFWCITQQMNRYWFNLTDGGSLKGCTRPLTSSNDAHLIFVRACIHKRDQAQFEPKISSSLQLFMLNLS